VSAAQLNTISSLRKQTKKVKSSVIETNQMQQLYYELRQQIKERKERNKQLRQQNSELAAKREVLANTYATLSQSQESAEQQARVHILYSENLAHSELKDRTLATYQLEAENRVALRGKPVYGNEDSLLQAVHGPHKQTKAPSQKANIGFYPENRSKRRLALPQTTTKVAEAKFGVAVAGQPISEPHADTASRTRSGHLEELGLSLDLARPSAGQRGHLRRNRPSAFTRREKAESRLWIVPSGPKHRQESDPVLQ
jgi:hypothetical protein